MNNASARHTLPRHLKSASMSANLSFKGTGSLQGHARPSAQSVLPITLQQQETASLEGGAHLFFCPSGMNQTFRVPGASSWTKMPSAPLPCGHPGFCHTCSRHLLFSHPPEHSDDRPAEQTFSLQPVPSVCLQIHTAELGFCTVSTII